MTAEVQALAPGAQIIRLSTPLAVGAILLAMDEHGCLRGRIPGHVRVLWGERAQDRWALVTNDPTLTGWEYAQRMWIEQAFRDLKSHGWQVEQSRCARLSKPCRAVLFLQKLWDLISETRSALALHYGCPLISIDQLQIRAASVEGVMLIPIMSFKAS